MRSFFRIFLLMLCVEYYTYAIGIEAGTVITNQAKIEYNVGAIDYNLTTNTDQFLVDQIIDIDISWQDTASVEVGSAETNRVLTYTLANVGNGDDAISLAYEHNLTDSFSPAPTNVRIYIDADGNGVFDMTTDTLASDVNLSSDTNITIFLVSDIPDTNYTISTESHEIITATSENNATAGTDNQNSVDLVVRTGLDSDTGSYIIRDFWLQSQKRAILHSDDNQTHTGTIITYEIEVFIGGVATGRQIDSIIIADSIPVGTLYRAGSLRLDGATLTDIIDVDSGQYDNNQARVNVGTIVGSEHHIVAFDVQVQ